MAGKVDWLAFGLEVEGDEASKPTGGDVARRDVPTCGLDDTLGDVRRRTAAAGLEVCVVVNAEGVVFGVLRGEQLGGPDEQRVEEAMQAGPSTFRPHVSIGELAEYMSDHHVDNAPITTSDGKLVGVLFVEDAQRAASR